MILNCPPPFLTKIHQRSHIFIGRDNGCIHCRLPYCLAFLAQRKLRRILNMESFPIHEVYFVWNSGRGCNHWSSMLIFQSLMEHFHMKQAEKPTKLWMQNLEGQFNAKLLYFSQIKGETVKERHSRHSRFCYVEILGLLLAGNQKLGNDLFCNRGVCIRWSLNEQTPFSFCVISDTKNCHKGSDILN